MEILRQTYWPPIFAYLRYRGYDAHQAEDLTQAFFTLLLEKNSLQTIRREGGRFRAYLLTALKHFLTNEWQRAQTQKRGGGVVHLSIDQNNRDDAETRYHLDLKDSTTPEDLFERRWASLLLDRVFLRLRRDYAAGDKADLFERLQVFLSGDKGVIPYADVATELGLSEGAVKVAVHRLRKRYGELLREEIAQTVASPEDVADEIRHLISVMSR